MNYSGTATTTPYAFTLWPDASEEELAVWAQAAAHSQENNDFSLGDLDSALAWGQSATLPATTYDLQNNFEPDWTTGCMGPVGDILGVGASLADATATDALAFAPAPTPAFLGDGMDALTQDFSFGEYGFSNSHSSTPSLTTVSSFPSPQSDGTGDGFMSLPTSSGATFIQPSGPSSSSSQLDTTGEFECNQFTCPPPLCFTGEGNLAGPLPPDFLPLDLMGVISNMSYPMQSDCANDYMTAPSKELTTVVTGKTVPSSSSRGKRRRESEGGEPGQQKKSRPDATGGPGEAKSTKRARRSPGTRTQKSINSKSKAAGRGAERLAPTTAQGVYCRPLLGRSVSQGSTGALVPGQSSWIEEREVEMRQDTGSATPQQIVLQSAENVEDRVFRPIPRKLSTRQRLMLETTQADEERGAVSAIKCKLCPLAEFGSWETYKRHCKTCEKHPAELTFCPRCGDHFARSDSEKRHHQDEEYQEACGNNTSEEYAREKKQMVERFLREFEVSLDHCLRNGGEIEPFSDAVNRKLANTSKKVSKQETTWSEGDSWAAGLH